MAAAVMPPNPPGGNDGNPPWKGGPPDKGGYVDDDDDFEDEDEEDFWLRKCKRCKKYACLRKKACANPECVSWFHFWGGCIFLVFEVNE